MSTPAFIKSTGLVAAGSSPNTSTSITPTNVGDTLICVAVGQGTGTFGTVTNSKGSTVITDATTAHTAFYRVASCVSGGQTFTVPFTGFSEVWTDVYEVSNIGSFDAIATENSGSSNSPVTNSIVPAGNDEFLIAAIRTTSGTATFSSWTNGFTQNSSKNAGPSVADGYFVQTSGPSSINAGAALSTSESWIASLIAYKPTTAAYGLSAANGAYTLTGEAITLVEGGVNNYTLSAVHGSYSLAGEAAILQASSDYALIANSGTYNYIGGTSTTGNGILAATGLYSMTGIAAGLQPVVIISSHGGHCGRRWFNRISR